MSMRRSIRNTLWIAAFGMLAALAGFGVGRFVHEPGGVEKPATAKDFALHDLAGKTHTLGEWRGKLVLLNFWATWCPPCRREIPLFMQLQERYQGKGLQIVGIAVDNPEPVASYWQEMRLNYPILLADDHTFDLMAAYGNGDGSLPYSVLITPDGEVAKVKLGAFGPNELESLVQPLLRTAKPGIN
jgi:thiol-disulfide isomerase/thioredoxin